MLSSKIPSCAFYSLVEISVQRACFCEKSGLFSHPSVFWAALKHGTASVRPMELRMKQKTQGSRPWVWHFSIQVTSGEGNFPKQVSQGYLPSKLFPHSFSSAILLGLDSLGPILWQEVVVEAICGRAFGRWRRDSKRTSFAPGTAVVLHGSVTPWGYDLWRLSSSSLETTQQVSLGDSTCGGSSTQLSFCAPILLIFLASD